MRDRPKNAARAAEKRRLAALAEGRTIGPKGRPKWQCKACGGQERRVRSDGTRKCVKCYPVRKVGRPRTG